MNELETLRSLWAAKPKRKAESLICKVDGKKGSLDNQSWAFKVGYEFRDALDIKYEIRQLKLKQSMVWTQGPLLNFAHGDLINSEDGLRAVQVRDGSPMGWNATRDEMYQGSVKFTEYLVTDSRYSFLAERTCTQMQFLHFLITGNSDVGV